MIRLLIGLFLVSSALAQTEPSPTPSTEGSPLAAPSPAPNGIAEEIIPTYETQKHARTYILDIPAPRGQIVDRNGEPLAQNRLSYNLAITFPTPLEFSDAEALRYAETKIATAERLLGRSLKVNTTDLLKHYQNRGVLPFEIVQHLDEDQYDKLKNNLAEGLIFRPLYVRVYPQGRAAGQIVGYVGRTGGNPTGIIENHETLWPETAGREGLELTFDDMLAGVRGEYNITFDKDGQKVSEKIVKPPLPGHTVVTTLDLKLQELAEKTLEEKAKRGAIVIVDPNTGDVLALASWPTYNPNVFVPAISEAKFKELQDDPNIPLLPRAFRSAYPPGSVFKVAVGLAALETGSVQADDLYHCWPALQIGNTTMRNWKKVDRGLLNFHQAMTESCDTWFYQVGIRMGSAPIIDWAQRLGFGQKTGIPLRGEVAGRVPTDQYMKAAHGRKLLNGDIANMSIGQGDLETTPLQMAQAMGIVANGGTFYQTRLVQQVQSVENEIVTAFQVRQKKTIGASSFVIEELRRSLVNVVSGAGGTGHSANLAGVDVAGKTGTAQWGPKKKERTAAWFGGFLPAEQPRFAFAAVYEGAVGADVHGGSHAAPLIAEVFKQVYKTEKERVRRAVPVDPNMAIDPQAFPPEEEVIDQSN